MKSVFGILSLSLYAISRSDAILLVQAQGQLGGSQQLGLRIGQWQGGHNLGNGRSLNDLLAQRLTANDSIEAVVGIRCVIHDALVTIGIDQRVLSLDLITLAGLCLALDVAGVVVTHGVGEVVMGRRLHLDGLQQWLHQVRRWCRVDGAQLDGSGSSHAQDEHRHKLE